MQPSVERLTDYILHETPRPQQEMEVEQVLHAPLSKLIDPEASFEGQTATLTEVALDVMSQLGELDLGEGSRVLVLGTATAAIPYAAALERVLQTSLAEAPRFQSDYLLAKRNVTHADKNLTAKQSFTVEAYVAAKGHNAIKQDEINRLKQTYAVDAAPPDAVVVLDESNWTSKTLQVGKEIAAAAFGDNTPLITLTKPADLPWQYEGKAELVVADGPEGKKLSVTPVEARTKLAFGTVANETIRYIQEAVRGQHPDVVKAYPNLDFDLTGEKKIAALVKRSHQVTAAIRQQIDEAQTMGAEFKPMIEVLEGHLAEQDQALADKISLYGLSRQIK